MMGDLRVARSRRKRERWEGQMKSRFKEEIKG
jgi:hypothetical protein